MTRIAFVLLLTTTLVGVVVAQRPTGTARVSGVIVADELQATPIGGAVVTLSGNGLGRARSVITDARGAFAFAAVPAGRFILTAAKAPYLEMAYGARKPGRQGTAITVGAGADVRDISWRLPRGGVITGSIRDETGAPIADITVAAARVGEVTRVGLGSTAPSSVTDDRGIYRIFGLAPGSYLVTATFRTVGTGEAAAPSTDEVDRVLVELQRRGTRAGGGTAAAGTPAPALATAEAYGLAPTFYPGTTSASDAEQVVVEAGEEKRADFVIAPVRSGSVEGVILDLDGSPLGGAPLPSLDPQGPIVSLSFGQGPTLTVRPGGDGRFKFSGVTPGRYLLSLRIGPGGARGQGPNVLPAGRSFWAEVDIVSTGDNLSGVVLALQPGRRFAGAVAFEGASPRPPDFSRLRLSIQSTKGARTGAEFGISVAPSSSAVLTVEGTFEVLGIVPGPYEVVAPTLPQWQLRSVIVSGKDALDDGLTVPRDADLTGVVVTYTDKHSELSGTLQTAANVPAPDYFIVVMPTERGWWKPGARRIKATRPANDGHFSFADLPGGEYYLAALTDVAAEDLADSAFLAQIVPAAVKVVVTDGGKTTQNLRIGAR